MTKRIFGLIVLFFGICFAVQAADEGETVIVMENGDVIKAYNVEIGPSAIFYTTDKNPDSSFNKIKKEDVIVIKYSNGEKWMPGENTSPSAVAPQTQTQSVPSNNLSFSDDQANRAAFERNSPDNVKFVGTAEDKDAGEVLLLYRPTKESVLADKNLDIKLVSRIEDEDSRNEKNGFKSLNVDIVITNHSDAMAYVDLGNTYFISNGESFRYFVPSATSNTTSTSTGASVNLGAVAGAIGLGGGIGTLASGINVGGGKTNTSSTVTFAERILSIPPGATKVLSGVKFPDYGKVKETGRNVGRDGTYANLSIKLPKDEFYKIGETVTDFNKGDFFDASAIVTYGLSEDLATPVQLKATYKPDRMIAAKMGKLIDQPIIDTKYFTDNFNDCLFMFFRLAKLKK